MKTIIFTLAIALLFSCTKENVLPIPKQIETEYLAFLYHAQKYGVKLKSNKLKGFILSGKLETRPMFQGYYSNDTKIIYIDTTSKAYIGNKECFLFHELGHALLRRSHNEDFLENGESASVMNELLPKSYLQNKEYYLDELFTKPDKSY